ncbi:zinc finger protein 184-like isoform X2 [Argopecten irradians]|uniref:zinc finger protein 184-like isoform X2 n=1 Tax=Argopecten irradians TaxID=31199 RepID=UPI0037172A68
MAENQNIELVLHMVNKMCGELVDKGFEYYLVTACPTKAFNIGSTKGRHFLQDNKDLVQRFIKHCYGARLTDQGQNSFKITNSSDNTRRTKNENSSQTSKVHCYTVDGLKQKQVETLTKGKDSGAEIVEKDGSKECENKDKEEIDRSEESGNEDIDKKEIERSEESGNEDIDKKEIERSEESGNEDIDKKEIERSEESGNEDIDKKEIERSEESGGIEAQLKLSTDSSTHMVLRVKRKRKTFSDCEMRPVFKSIRQTFQSDLKTSLVGEKKQKETIKGSRLEKKELKTPDKSSEKMLGRRSALQSVKECSVQLISKSDNTDTERESTDKRSKRNKVRKSDSAQSNTVRESTEKSSKRNKVRKSDSTQSDTERESTDTSSKGNKVRKSDSTQSDTERESTDKSSKRNKVRKSDSTQSDTERESTDKSSKRNKVRKSDRAQSDTERESTDKSSKRNKVRKSDRAHSDLWEESRNIPEKHNTGIKSTADISSDNVKLELENVGPKMNNDGPESNNVVLDSDKVVSDFRCKTCNKEFKGKGALGRHMIVHSTKCSGCQLDFADHDSLIYHRKRCPNLREITRKLYPCDKCDLVCIASWSLRRHQIASHEWRCRFCKQLYSSEARLDKHLETCIDKAVKEEERRQVSTPGHVCDTCGKQFANKGILMSHKRCHTQDVARLISEMCGIELDQVQNIVDDQSALLSCEGCAIKFSTQQSLKVHRKSCVMINKPFVCQHCDKSFNLRCELNKHAKNTHPDTYNMRDLYRYERDLGKQIHCRFCNQTSYNQTWMEAHSQKHIDKGDVAIEVLLTSETGNTELNKANSEVSNTTSEVKEDGNTTSEISNTTSEISNTTSEISNTTSEISNITSEISNTTSEISNTTSEISNITSEISNTTSEISNTTSEISNTTSEISNTTSEISNITSEVKRSADSDTESRQECEVKPVLTDTGDVLLSSLRCHHCKISFKDKHELYCHAVSHRTFKCETCGKVLASAGSLKKHRIIAHSDQRDFICELCGKWYKTQQCVNQHIRKVHINSKPATDTDGPFPCPKCDKVFDSKRLLTKHKYNHKDRSTACPVCSKCFSGRGEMLYHLKHVHSDARNYVCDICQRAYKTNSSLREHHKQHHEGREGWRHACQYC